MEGKSENIGEMKQPSQSDEEKVHAKAAKDPLLKRQYSRPPFKFNFSKLKDTDNLNDLNEWDYKVWIARMFLPQLMSLQRHICNRFVEAARTVVLANRLLKLKLFTPKGLTTFHDLWCS